MRIARLRLENYGPFEARDLAFDTRPGTVNLVIAPNGAGKSVLRQALRDFVFGIPGQSPMSFRFGYKGMRLLADVVDADGTAISLGRRKGRGHTLIGADGADVPEALLSRLTGGADDALFQRLFSLDTHLLRVGGEALIATGGEINDAVFAAGGGTLQIRGIREAFEKARDDIAPARLTATKPFYLALEDQKTASADLKHDLVRPEDWRRQQADRAATAARLTEIREAQGHVRVEVEKLNRIRRVRPWLEQHRLAVAALAPVADHPALPAGLDKDWQRAGDALAAAEAQLATRQEELTLLQARATELRPDQALLAEAEAIDDMHRTLGEVGGDHRDLPRVAAAEQASADLVAALERDLGLAPGAALPSP
ncbi:AAA family ATPase, partial [Zavarzinia sp.]|uniref:AAA family ATPase n=1 Tax=Zavarzinia sp. TaxID=2027920 RepID=UPI003BB51EA0